MQLRRGLIFALVHLIVCTPVFLLMEARIAENARATQESTAEAAREFAAHPPAPAAPTDVGETVRFDPCTLWGHTPAEQVILFATQMPAMIVAGWGEDCPSRWSVAGHMVALEWWTPQQTLLARQKRLDRICLGLIAALWLAVGSFPLLHPHRRWLEPGALITICVIPGCALAMIQPIDGLANLFALPAFCAWWVWAVILLTLPFRLLWRWIRHQASHRSPTA